MQFDEFLGRFSDVRAEGDGYLATCPGHSDSKPSLRIAAGHSAVLVRCRARCSTPDVLRAVGLTMSDLAGIDLNTVTRRARSTSEPASDSDVEALEGDLAVFAAELDEEVREYARSRFGLDDEAVDRLGLGRRDDRHGLRLVVPLRDRSGKARGYQARALDKTAAIRWLGPKSPQGASWAKIGLFEGSSGWGEVVVTEGPGDALTAVGAGYDAVAVCGAALVGNPAIVDAIVELLAGRVAVIAGDGDDAGRQFAETLERGLLDRSVQAKSIPLADGEDLTSWRGRVGPNFGDELVAAIRSARFSSRAQLATALRDETEFPLTDLGNARFVRKSIRAQGSDVRFSPEAGFFLLDGGVWRSDRLDKIRGFAHEAAELTSEIAGWKRDAGDPDARAWIMWGKFSESSRGLDSALRELQALASVATDIADFDKNPDLLGVRNGLVDLRTGELLPENPAALVTRRIDVDYRPDAACPRWERFMVEVFPDQPEMPAYIRRLVGYGVTGHVTEQCFAVLWGSGANGKSVFTDTLATVFREVTVTTPFATFEEKPSGGIPNDLAALKGARLVFASEGEHGKPMAEALLKRVTGRDLISARFMRREFFEFRPSFLLMLATNAKPNFRGQDEGLWRRVKLIPFTRYFAPNERDHRLGDDLAAEAEGILAWAVRGAVEWRAQGLSDPDAIRDATAEYRKTSDSLYGFLPGEYLADPKARPIPALDLFGKFQEYADENNLTELRRWSSRAFYRAVEERGFVRRRGTGGTMLFEGIRKATKGDHEEPPNDPRSGADTTSERASRSPSLKEIR